MEYKGKGNQDEEIQGAPAVLSDAEVSERRLSDTFTVNRFLYLQSQQLVHMLLQTSDLQPLMEILLVSMPRHFGFPVSELWLYDPEGVLVNLIGAGDRYDGYLQLHQDIYDMQEMYDLEPDIVRVDATDTRRFEILKSDSQLSQAVLIPLMDSGRIIGSFHLGLEDDSLALGDAEEDILANLGTTISSCFRAAVTRAQASRLTMLDPITEISNLRGFEKDIAREISRARRSDQPITVLLIEIDEYRDLYANYGDVTGQFILKKVAERISSGLRATDLLARLSESTMALLIPGSGESLGEDIAERMRVDIGDFAMDDGRGAVLQVSLSIGLVTWEPQHYQAVDMPQLARQMEALANRALRSASDKGGNSVKILRLNTLLV